MAKQRKKRTQRSRSDWLREIKAWRKSSITQADFALDLDCHPTMISKWNRIFVSEGSLPDAGTTMNTKPKNGSGKANNFLELTNAAPVFTLKRGDVELSIPADTDPETISNLLSVIGG